MHIQPSTTNHAFPVFGFMGFLSMIILLSMYSRAQGVGVCLYIIWTGLLCLVFSVNSVVWDNNVVNWAPVWCDISSRLVTAGSLGSQAGLLCIIRHLYCIITMKTINRSIHQARLDLIFDLYVGIGLPILILLIQYVLEGYRFIILENIGCYPAVILTSLAIPLYAIWPSIFGLTSAFYAGFTIRVAIKQKAYRRKVMQDNQYVQSTQYWRLLVFSGIGISCTLPSAVVNVVTIVVLSGGMIPFTWKSIHDISDNSSIPQITVSQWTNIAIDGFGYESARWFPVLCALIFFTFFGSTKDARRSYRLACLWVISHLGFHAPNLEILNVRSWPFFTHPVRHNHASCPPVVSGTTIGSLRFISYISSNQIIVGSATQSSRFWQLFLPPFSPSLSVGDPWRSCTGELSGSFLAPEHAATFGSVNRSTHHDENGFALPAMITTPAPVLEVSTVLRRHSFDSPILVPCSTHPSPTSVV